jgi:uncharacterized protein (TIGR00369 family)
MVEGTPRLHLYNPIGTVHGGYAASLLDNACGHAVQSKMMSGSTLELKVAFHKAITKDTGPLRAEDRLDRPARRLHRGKTERPHRQALRLGDVSLMVISS